MDEFCGSPFWDSQITWNTSNPRFTECFEKSVLVWTPCAFLWVFSLFEISNIANSKERNIPWNYRNITKLILIFLLISLAISDLVIAIYKDDSPEVEFYTPIIKILTFILAVVFLCLDRIYGLRTSGLLFLFWFILLIFSIPQLSSLIKDRIEENPVDTFEIIDDYSYITFIIYFVLVSMVFLLNCFADAAPIEAIPPTEKQPCPERESGFLSRLLYGWFDALIWKGYKNPLTYDDLWDTNPEDKSAAVLPLFDKNWKKVLNKTKTKNSKHVNQSKDSKHTEKTKKKYQASIIPALWKTFGSTLLFGGFLKFIQDVIAFLSPQILSLLIEYIGSDDYAWKGYLYAFLLFITAMVQTLVLAQYFHRMYIVGLQIRTALTNTVYRKALRLSNSARKESTVGEIVNLMSVDAVRFMDLMPYLHMIWSGPLQIGLSIFFLWRILGPAVFAGLAVMILLIPINGIIAQRIQSIKTTQMKHKDERVKMMNEILNGIKVLKFYAWEPSFENHVMNIRNKELKVLKQSVYLSAATSFTWTCAPFLVSLVSFATFIFIDPENNILDANTAFVSLSLFNILRFPLSVLPYMIMEVVQTIVSTKRLNKFMNSDDLAPDNVFHDSSKEDPLIIENGNFSWGDTQILRNINVKISSGSLVAIVGSVGSGKSSLVSSFLGEMDKISGRVNTYGSIAYVAQQAWIQNATLQNNVLFGATMDKDKYDDIIRACALKPDLEMFPGGDQTEIGEKGINLSGGQKQRVSLARAVYSDREIYFLDDPLSAVDSHVGKHIFENVIGNTGLLKGKTRVLVTHGITYLPKVDNIIVVKDGEITEAGTYNELLEKKGAFAEFLIQHITENSNKDESELIEIKQQLEIHLGEAEFKNKVERSRLISESSVEVPVEPKTPVLNEEVKPPQSNDDEDDKNKLIGSEKMEIGGVKWGVYAHYFKSIGLNLTFITIIMNAIFQAFSIGSNVWLSIWSTDHDIIVNGTMDTQKRDLYLGVYGGLGIGQALTSFFCDLAPRLGCWMAARAMHNVLLKGILRSPMSFFDTTPSGRILARFAKDVDVIDSSLPEDFSSLIYCLYEVVATLVVICISTPEFVIVIIPISIIYYFIQRFYVMTSRQLKRLDSVSNSPIFSHFGETIAGATTIRAYGYQTRFTSESESKVDYNQVCRYPGIISNRWLAVRLEMIGNFIILFAALFAVIGRENANPGLVGLSVTYALQITLTLNWLVRMTSEVETNIVAVERIKEYEETKKEAEWDIQNTRPKPEWPVEGNVKIDELVLRYREMTDPVLCGVTCEIKAGEKVGIVGRTGAGKSTLTLALFRLVEAHSGKIMIDNIDISILGLHSLRSRLTIIPQDPVLFSGTLRMNLDPFDKFTDDEIWRALEHAHLKSYVKGLDNGFNHVINEGGENLSVGQRQLVCLARALLRKTQILILDEATAAVDLETDSLIQETIRKEFSTSTILTIAHRLNTIMDYDRVLVLDKGLLIEFDSPANLLRDKTSSFYGMARDAGLIK